MAQIGDAMAQLDRATHANAGQTEELAATARSLQEQADGLRTRLSAFHLDEPAGAPRSAAHGPPAAPPSGEPPRRLRAA